MEVPPLPSEVIAHILSFVEHRGFYKFVNKQWCSLLEKETLDVKEFIRYLVKTGILRLLKILTVSIDISKDTILCTM